MKRRPPPIALLSWLLILSGLLGLVYHAKDVNPQQPFQNDTVWVELVRVLAIISGVFMLRGCNWARWLAIMWIAFHVVISVVHSWQQVVMHAIVFAVFALFLFRPSANSYFCAGAGRVQT
jgi:hypothetical protein